MQPNQPNFMFTLDWYKDISLFSSNMYTTLHLDSFPNLTREKVLFIGMMKELDLTSGGGYADGQEHMQICGCFSLFNGGYSLSKNKVTIHISV